MTFFELPGSKSDTAIIAVSAVSITVLAMFFTGYRTIGVVEILVGPAIGWWFLMAFIAVFAMQDSQPSESIIVNHDE
jgi:purine-cytosine permease-like protein